MFKIFSTKGFRSYIKQAKKILNENWTGHYTKPSPSLYPHQWNWDSGFIAIGYAHYNQKRAQEELISLFSHQWPNGMVPQIVFNPHALGNYFPEPDFWKVPGNRLTSGITMPPLHATACLHIYQHARNIGKARDFLKVMYSKLIASHRYFYTYRDPDKLGLVYIRHPWESGVDNSPSWDLPLKNIHIDKTKLPKYERKDLKYGIPAEQRPSDDDYDRYVFLVNLFRHLNYEEEKIYTECPFLVQDVLFNSILCRANQELIEIGKIINEDVKEVEEWLDLTAKAISERMWSKERQQFDAIDINTRKHLPSSTSASFMPFFAVAATHDQAKLLYERLNSVSFCALRQGNCYTIPNFDMAKEGFDSKNYWRGPVWININWMLSQGLKNYGYQEKADSMKKDLIQLPVRFGFHEYFDSITGKGYGSSNFSWTAALFIDLVNEYYNQDKYTLSWFLLKKGHRLEEKKVLNQIKGITPFSSKDLDSKLMAAIGDLKDTFYNMKRGLVDYRAMKKSIEYRSYLELSAQLKVFDLDSVSSNEEKLAFWINLYNSIVVHGIIELDIISSVLEVSNFFSHICYQIGDYMFSPEEIEHGILRCNARPPYRIFPLFRMNDARKKFVLDKPDSRIHFALVCGSRSCPPVHFYKAEKIDEQLENAARNFVNSSEVVILPEKKKVLLSQIFDWYAKDIGTKKDIFEFLLRYLVKDDKAQYLEEHMDDIKVEFLYYDWNLNH